MHKNKSLGGSPYKRTVAVLVLGIVMATAMLVLPLLHPPLAAQITQMFEEPAQMAPTEAEVAVLEMAVPQAEPAPAKAAARPKPAGPEETEPETSTRAGLPVADVGLTSVVGRPVMAEEEIRLPVAGMLQLPELPDGCEATSLAMLLNHLGIGVDKMKLAEEVIPRRDFTVMNGVSYGPDPNEAYAGNPADGSGFYVLAPALAKAADSYLQQQGSELRASSLSGASEDELVAQLRAGRPVIVWSTMDYGPAQYAEYGWVVEGAGAYYLPYVNLHCMVLVGCTEDTFLLRDPLRPEVQEVGRTSFMKGYAALGAQAVEIS